MKLNIKLPSIFAIFALRVIEIWEALLSSASLNCCDDHVIRFDSISFVQHVPPDDDDDEGQIDSGTPEKIR